MAETLIGRAKRAWNAFFNKDPTVGVMSGGYTYRPDRSRLSRGNERTILTSVYNKIAMDVASINIKHVQLDANERYTETLQTPLNNCLTLEANLDQTGRAFIQDAVMSMFDEGVVCLAPIDIDKEPRGPGSIDVYTIRTAKVLEWYPDRVKINAYNERKGVREDLIMHKRAVCLIENPMFAVMNEPNSTVQRLKRKLALLDVVDEQTSSGKLDLIIQLPYVIKSEARREQAEKRRKDIEDQLASGKYGIAYTDGTERITQLNRPVENNLMKQIEYLTELLFSQLGLTQGVLDGTADEKTMLNYYNRTIEPILSAIADEMKRKFLTQDERDDGQSIMFFRDPFKLVPVSELAEISDKMTRNEIMTSNEVRQVIGMKPSKDPAADELRNKNLSQSTAELKDQPQPQTTIDEQLE